nr:oxoglutarate/iron-dependent dioxygenase [Tanacetum cinerariifolium]
MVTNGDYKSIEHRAVMKANKERLSIDAFVSPNVDGNIGPATSLITPEKPPRFRRVPLSDYMKNRLSRKLD